MVNILEAQQQENKELLNEIETLKRQLKDQEEAFQKSEENLKWIIWQVSGGEPHVENSMYNFRPGH